MDEAIEQAIRELASSIRFDIAEGMDRDAAIEKAKKETTLGPASLERVLSRI